MKPGTSKALLAVGLIAISGSVLADDNSNSERKSCSIPPATVNAVQGQLAHVVAMNNGALFSPSKMWSAVVDRQGVLCGWATCRILPGGQTARQRFRWQQ